MLMSNDRILTSHVGSLPRPQDLLDLLEAKETGETIDEAEVTQRIETAIEDVVQAQRNAGVDIVNVGPKPAEKELPKTAQHRDLMDHPGMVERTARINQGMSWFDRAKPPAAIGPVSYGDKAPLERDLSNLKSACNKLSVQEAFVNSVSPGVMTKSRMRMHVCWGNYEGPHTHDIPFSSLHPVVMKARPAGLLIEGANPAHAHEWEDMKRLGLPDDKVLLPGVIDTTTNFVENPRLVAQRIGNWANAVGKERVIASTDCGFATFAGPNNPVIESIVWEKLKALSSGAALASKQLW